MQYCTPQLEDVAGLVDRKEQKGLERDSIQEERHVSSDANIQL